MIRVTIELLSAVTGRTSTIGTMYIANDGTGTAERGDYKVAACKRGSDDVPRDLFDLEGWSPDAIKRHPKAARAGEVKNYPRLAYNVWRLIARSVLAAFPEEAKRAKRDERTLLDEQVMSGLAELSRLAQLAGIPCGPMYDDRTLADVKTAIAWLEVANSEPDPS